jgi:hypothetical protein
LSSCGHGGADRLIAGDYRRDATWSQDLIFLSNIIHGETRKRTQRSWLLARHSTPAVASSSKTIFSTRLGNVAGGAIFSMLMSSPPMADAATALTRSKLGWQAGLQSILEIVLPPPMTSSLVIGAGD